MNKILAFALSLLLAACASTEPPQSAPPSVSWQHMGSKSYESENPGLGTSQRYASAAGWIDVHVYGLRRNDWKPGVSDPQFAAHFQSTVAEVRYMGQRGMYGNLQIGATRDVQVAGQVYRTVSFRFSRDNKPIVSATYLTAQDGQLLKYRVSLYAESGLDIDAVATSFIEERARPSRVGPAKGVALLGTGTGT